MSKYYINTFGELCSRNKFLNREMVVYGAKVTELWCDSYQANYRKGDEILFPADLCPFEVVEHREKKYEFVEKGGGFRIDLVSF